MEYLPYSPKYEDAVINLLNESFAGKDITRSSFEWKHYSNYFNGKTISMIAVENGDVCSFVCFTPIVINKNGKRHTFYSCSVQVTHKNYRRRGIVSNLTQIIEKKIGANANYLGFSNNSGVQIDLHSKRINYKILGRMRTYYLLAMPVWSDMSFRETSNPDIFENLFSDSRLEFDNSSDYLKWKYDDNPKNKFIYLEILKSNKTVALVILKKSMLKLEILSILAANINDFSDIIVAISRYAFEHLCLLVSATFMPNKQTAKFEKIFLYKRDIDIYLTVKSPDAEFLESDNWVIQGGDIQ